MFDRKLLLGLGLAILLAITPVAFAQSGQSGTSSDPANQQGAVGSSQSQSSMAEQGNVDWTDARYSKDEVRLVQEALKSRGMDPGPIDGIKGSKTKQALREFQKQNNLTVVGDINNDTLRALGVWDGPLSGSRATGQASTGTSTEGSQTSSSQSSSTSDTGTIDPSTGQTRSEDSTSSQPGTDTTTAPDTTPAPDTTTTQPDTTPAPDTTTAPDTTSAPDTTMTQPDTTTAPDTTTTPPGTDSTTAPDSSTTQSDTTGQTTSQGSQTGMVGQPGASAEQPGTGDHSEVVRSATEVFRQFNQANASSSTMRDAKAIAIIPGGSSSMGAGAHGGMGAGAHSSTSTQSSTGSMGTQGSTSTQGTTSTQGSMGMSAQSGRGLIVRKNTDGSWSRIPAFIRMSGGSTELQSSTSGGDLVFLFSDENSINALMDGSLDLATEVTVQAGPSGPMGATGSTGTTGMTGTMGTTGSTGTAGSTGTMGSTGTTGTQDTTSSTTQTGRGVVYAYSRSAGSYSGTSVTSGTITIDDSANQSAYGRQVSARDLLSSDATQSQVQASSTLQPFIDAISSQAPSRAE